MYFKIEGFYNFVLLTHYNFVDIFLVSLELELMLESMSEFETDLGYVCESSMYIHPLLATYSFSILLFNIDVASLFTGKC